jgi:transcriptional regulator with XRE-family HTH domain
MTPVTSLSFGPLLKRARRAARLTQAELAERAGFSVVYISMLERGARQPQPTTVALLADALVLSSDERAALEQAAQPATTPAPNRHRSREGTALLPIGAFLGALPSAPLVGRVADLEIIGSVLAAVAQGQGRLLVLIGEPGVGKTRLAQEISLRARAQGFRILTGRCYEPQQTLAYSPFLEALTQAVALTTETTDVAARWPEMARLLPGQPPVHTTDTRPSSGADDAARQRLYYQLTGFLSALAEPQPLALLLDDLHWADGASLELLQHLARHTRDQPLLLVGTTRAVEAARQHPLVDALRDLGRDELVEQLQLSPLAAEETAALIGVTLGGADGAVGDASSISAELATRIQARSEGNAFFARQLARALQEQGGLSFSEGQWRLREITAVASTPASIRAVIEQRLSRLTPHTQEVLREASVLGQVVAFDALEHIGGRGEQEVEEALEEASGAGILREGQRDQYHFNHALTRDTLYAELSARRRRRLHRAAGETIERLPAHAQRAAELTYHFLAADEGERALPYALLAGDQAEAVYAHAEAEGRYREALAVAREIGDAARKAEALKKLGQVAAVQGRNDEATVLLEEALPVYQALEDQDEEMQTLAALLQVQSAYGRETVDALSARAQTILARIDQSDGSLLTPARAAALAAIYNGVTTIYFTSGRYDDMVPAARRAADLARAAGDEAQLAYALHHLYIMGALDDDPTALETILALAERSGQTRILVAAHNMMGGRHADAGEFALALPHLERSLAAAERRQDPIKLAWQLSNFVVFLLASGDWRRAHETYARAEALLREADPHAATLEAAVISLWPGLFALMEGREEKGRRLLTQSIERIEQVGAVFVLAMAIESLAEADLLAGHAEQARRRLTTFLRDRHPLLAENNALGAHILLAWAETVLGAEAQAEERLAMALACAPMLLRVDALRAQGLLATKQDRCESAIDALNEALALTRAMPYPYAEAKALWVYGQLEAARGDPAGARERFTQAMAICDRLGEGLYRPHIERDLVALG